MSRRMGVSCVRCTLFGWWMCECMHMCFMCVHMCVYVRRCVLYGGVYVRICVHMCAQVRMCASAAYMGMYMSAYVCICDMCWSSYAYRCGITVMLGDNFGICLDGGRRRMSRRMEVSCVRCTLFGWWMCESTHICVHMCGYAHICVHMCLLCIYASYMWAHICA